ncbi:hypothetical protein [Yersinia intermedia]|uniref:Uncharacterized protein n=2 Tax=Yersinia intermedia TaxID=631 RepID=A0A209A3W0_YERIN|nr:hypothetical protein [Yersinia intermedia]MCB5320553.1 hypothetical protein [Yersinia intermedia]OVZ87358.1 hypothetical protein CBW57_07055 [Yersinia intermedia]UZM73103.1 hypothetical protein OP861_10880 [Yersinia intermedia]WET13632.1 hypothetical protein P2W49_13230 [Yersinia intermedia]
MTSISYRFSNEILANMVQPHDKTYAENEIFNIKIDEKQLFLGESDGVNKVLKGLYKNDWVNFSENYQDTNLHNLLSSLAETSLAERMIGFDNALKCGLLPDYNATFYFEGNGQSGVKMHYGVIHSEDNCNLFKLTGEFLFDKDCKLSHEKSFISIDFSPQCPPVLEEALDSRTVIKKFLDWLMNLFNLNGFVFESSQFDADMAKNIAVIFSNINKDDGNYYVIENRANEEREDNSNQSLKINYRRDGLNIIEKMIEELSANIGNDIENDEQDIEQLEIDSVKFTQDLEERNDGLVSEQEDHYEWDYAV